MKIKRHIPNFIDTHDDEPEPWHHFETFHGLINIPFVKDWTRIEGFVQLAISHYHDDHFLLMAEIKEPQATDRASWVVGYMTDVDQDSLNLPTWEA